MAASCPACGAAVGPDARFCLACGTALAETCSRCGAQVPPGARFCPSCGHALRRTIARAEERKVVTILFADVTGSTTLGEQLDPERVRTILAEYFAGMSAVIESWGGTVEKFVGDAIMAAFGVPVVREDDPGRALHAALEMHERLRSLNVGFANRHGVRLAIRVGVNTGEVIAPVGEHVDQLIVAGDPVNTAARLEQAAEPGTTLVGERTFLGTRDAFRFGPPEALELKGKTERVIARPLLGVAAEPDRGVPGLRARLIGRDRELATLSGLLDEAIERHEPRLAIVYGPAGIGKSRLVWEVTKLAAARRPAPVVLRGRCLAAGHGVTFWALAEILRNAIGIGLDDPAETVRTRLRDRATAVLGTLGLSDADATETIYALATTADIELPGSPLRSLEPKAVAEALVRAWPRFVSALADARPLVLIVEDLHWAGDQLVEMLERLLVRSTGPILFLATARPEFAERHRAFGGGRENVGVVSLRPLTSAQSADLIASLLTTDDLPATLREVILERADGNPFFLEEIVRRLIDEGAVVSEAGRWKATGAAAMVVLPDTIQALLAARMDGLRAELKLVLQEASVVGKVFWEAPVRRSLPEVDVASSLLDLEARGFVVARPTSTIAGQTEYLFRHVLVRDVAYASLPRGRRARSHAAVAEWIEELAADRLDEFAELRADHFWLAVAGEDADLGWSGDDARREGLRARAFGALLGAGRIARRRFALTRALELHGQAQAIASSAAERAEALEATGDDHAAAYHGDEAVSAYGAALKIARSDHAAAAARARLTMKAAREAVMKQGTFRSHPGPPAVEALVDEGLSATPDEQVRAWLLALRGELYEVWASTTGHDPAPVESRVFAAQQALELAGRLDRPGLQVFASEVLMSLYHAQGAYEQAAEVAHDRLALAERVESPSTRASLLFTSGELLMTVEGRLEDGLELARRSYQDARTLSIHERMHATGTILHALYLLGRWAEALVVLDDHMEAFWQEANVTCGSVRIGPEIGALMRAQRGEAGEARRLLGLAPPIERTLGFVDGYRAQALAALADPEAALAEVGRVLARPTVLRPGSLHVAAIEALAALETWDGLSDAASRAGPHAAGYAPLGPAIDRAIGLRLAATGKRRAARVRLTRAANEFARLGMAFEAARAQEALARVVGGGHERLQLLEAALGVYRDLGAGPSIDRVSARLDRAPSAGVTG